MSNGKKRVAVLKIKCQHLTPGRKTVDLKRKLLQNRHWFIRVVHLESILLIQLQTAMMDHSLTELTLANPCRG